MSQLLLHNARIALEGSIVPGGLLIRDGRIAEVFTDEHIPLGLGVRESFDMEESLVAPGLIDIHIHGSAGVDVQDADRARLVRMSEYLLAEGVTGYLATLVPTDTDGYLRATREIYSFMEDQDRAGRKAGGHARIAGIHFEGPFVSEQRCGALRRDYFRTYDGDPRALELFFGGESSRPAFVRAMTLAPETRGGLDLVRATERLGGRAFIGHSQAGPEILDLAAEAGARHITHFPNALDALHHRKPGAVGWGLTRDDITVDVIADLHHVHPLVLQLIYRCKSAGRMALISDAIQPAGLGDGEFTVWGEKITVRGGRTALADDPEETIAGSVITLRQALKNMSNLGLPLHEALHMCSLVPARACGIDGDYGSLETGKRADVVVFDDELNVRLAFLEGAVAIDRR
ncbi:MAG TPA: N-acetylglucosamine-6-phosphate deacetylase [Blastocatellia bacterium]|jgi:N-acetylglucosamine-6-phosphate deacetylase|nr:N-acetylglucosamine-6-phosphate deacetylase [Blastocatellia bacterium]